MSKAEDIAAKEKSNPAEIDKSTKEIIIGGETNGPHPVLFTVKFESDLEASRAIKCIKLSSITKGFKELRIRVVKFTGHVDFDVWVDDFMEATNDHGCVFMWVHVESMLAFINANYLLPVYFKVCCQVGFGGPTQEQYTKGVMNLSMDNSNRSKD